MQSAYWLASALWYGSLVLSILGVLAAAQQFAVLDILGPPPAESNQRLVRAYVHRYLPLMLSETRQEEPEAAEHSGRGSVWKPRRKMIFTWQCPVMFMSYSACLFLAGLTIFVCSPLVRESVWSAGGKVSLPHTSFPCIPSHPVRHACFPDIP